MNSLELKIPPPAVAVIVAIAMWWLSLLTPALDLPRSVRVDAAFALAVLGLAIAIAGVVSFRRARTTVNPMKPETASALVTSGIYRWTRNPMYLGDLLVLLALAIWLASIWALAGVVAFALYIGRFQIEPEERRLNALFGADYAAYRARVRRWI